MANSFTLVAAAVPYTVGGTIIQENSDSTLDVLNPATWTWIQVIAALPEDGFVCGGSLSLSADNENYGETFIFEIGKGEAASEVTIARFGGRVQPNYTTAVGYSTVVPWIFMLPVPIMVNSGIRLAARCRVTSGGNIRLGISWYKNL